MIVVFGLRARRRRAGFSAIIIIIIIVMHAERASTDDCRAFVRGAAPRTALTYSGPLSAVRACVRASVRG